MKRRLEAILDVVMPRKWALLKRGGNSFSLASLHRTRADAVMAMQPTGDVAYSVMHVTDVEFLDFPAEYLGERR